MDKFCIYYFYAAKLQRKNWNMQEKQGEISVIWSFLTFDNEI